MDARGKLQMFNQKGMNMKYLLRPCICDHNLHLRITSSNPKGLICAHSFPIFCISCFFGVVLLGRFWVCVANVAVCCLLMIALVLVLLFVSLFDHLACFTSFHFLLLRIVCAFVSSGLAGFLCLVFSLLSSLTRFT